MIHPSDRVNLVHPVKQEPASPETPSPKSLNHSITQSLNPPVPQSLNHSISQSLNRKYDPRTDPVILDALPNDRAAWYESPDHVRRRTIECAHARRVVAYIFGRFPLTADDRAYLRLRYLESLSYRDIARKKGCAISTAHRRVLRALRKTRTLLDHAPLHVTAYHDTAQREIDQAEE